MMTRVNSIMISNESTSIAYEQLLMLSKPPISTYDDAIDAARTMLHSRKTYAQLNAACERGRRHVPPESPFAPSDGRGARAVIASLAPL